MGASENISWRRTKQLALPRQPQSPYQKVKGSTLLTTLLTTVLLDNVIAAENERNYGPETVPALVTAPIIASGSGSEPAPLPTVQGNTTRRTRPRKPTSANIKPKIAAAAGGRKKLQVDENAYDAK